MIEHGPPENVIQMMSSRARIADGCLRSRRVCAVYKTRTEEVLAVASNGPPADAYGAPSFRCDGSDLCKSECRYRCVHAEQRVIRRALTWAARHWHVSSLAGCVIVHGKFVHGQVVGGGGPSCWQCARDVVDSGLDGVWLREFSADPLGIDEVDAPAEWRSYTAGQFHGATIAHCDRHGFR